MYPVRLRAVVTFIDPGRTVFIQDETGGTFLAARSANEPVQPGQILDVEGVTYPGLYVPGITARKIHVIGPGQLPVPVPVTYGQLAAGQFNYEQVEVAGIVRSVVSTNEDRTILQLAMDGGRLEVQIYEGATTNELQWVDASVHVRGLAAGFINDRRQLVVPHLRLNSFQGVTLNNPMAADPFALPLSPVGTLLRFAPEGSAGHRLKVSGVVMYQRPGQALYLRDQDHGLYVQTEQTDAVHPGDVVEVLGFPQMGPFSAFLQDAVFRKTGAASKPSATPTSIKEILKGTQDANLVTLSADLLEVLSSANEWVLLMQADNVVFNARMARPGGDATLPELRPGSRLGLTGVCRVETSSYGSVSFSTRPSSFDLWLRSPADVAVLQAPSWWTVERLSIAVALLMFSVLAALAWVWLLQRRVQEQTQIISQKIQAEAAVEERQRIAREFHDTLEQELVGLSLRLDAVAGKVPDTRAREILEVARRLVARIQSEARHFVWNLRERALEETDVAGALTRSINALRNEGAAKLAIEVQGQPIRLPGPVEHDLLRIGQEAITNALKHAQARTIRVLVEYAPEAVRLSVIDDGIGFAGEAAAQARPGHFGLKGMEERARKIGATFQVNSRAGNGTSITVTAPGSAARVDNAKDSRD